MKKISKVLAGLVSVIVVGSCIASVPTSADVVYNDLDAEISYPFPIVDICTNENIDGITTYYLPKDFDIQDVIDDENRILVLNGQTFTLSRCDAISEKNWMDGEKHYYYEDGTVPTIDEGYEITAYIFKNTYEYDGHSWQTEWYYNVYDNVLEYVFPNIAMKPTEDPTIGDSDQTIGDSKVTALRGDVNLDGDVNGLDLLYLKKYLLGLIEW